MRFVMPTRIDSSGANESALIRQRIPLHKRFPESLFSVAPIRERMRTWTRDLSALDGK